MTSRSDTKSIFSKIIANEIPCYRIAEDNRFIAFLDIQPIALGHTLVVPKEQLDYLFDYDDHTLSMLILFAKKVAHAIQKEIPCKRIGTAVIGFEVPHAHVHLVPINETKDLDFSNKRIAPPHELMASTSERIRKAFCEAELT